jgi:hypothetical protein
MRDSKNLKSENPTAKLKGPQAASWSSKLSVKSNFNFQKNESETESPANGMSYKDLYPFCPKSVFEISYHPVINFGQRKKFLDLPDEHPSLLVTLDPDQFAKDLKDLDPLGWDPLPCNFW